MTRFESEIDLLMAQKGLRSSKSRRQLLEVLINHKNPMTLQEIINKSGSSLARSSAYRSLVELEAAGIVQRISGVDEFQRFELVEDSGSHHHHLMCTECGDMFDISLSDSLEKLIEQHLNKISKKLSFGIKSHKVDAIGICHKCKYGRKKN